MQDNGKKLCPLPSLAFNIGVAHSLFDEDIYAPRPNPLAKDKS